MANHTNQQNTVIATDETFNLGGILNQALIEILITKQIISEEELLSYIGKKIGNKKFF